MSRLQKLINEELEKNAPSNEVVLMGMDGIEIPEGDDRIEIMVMKSNEVNHLAKNVEETSTIASTIDTLTQLLKNMRVDGSDDKNISILSEAIHELTGLNNDYEIALESYSDPSYLRERIISTEGFLDVVKSIFIKIRDIIVGFFRALWSFIKSIFTLENKTDKVEKDNRSLYKIIMEDNLTIDPGNVTPIKTSIGAIVDPINPQKTDVVEICLDIVQISNNYKDVVNERLTKGISTLTDAVKSIEDLIRDMKEKETSISDLESLSANYKQMILSLLSMRETVLPNEVKPGTMPNFASEEINRKLSEYKKGGLSYCSLVSPEQGRDRLAYGYNVFAAYTSKMIEERDISKLDADDVKFAFSIQEQASKKTELGTNHIDPIMRTEVLETVYSAVTKNHREIKFEPLMREAEKLTNRISAVVDWMAKKGYQDLVKVDDFVESGCRNKDEKLVELFNKFTEISDAEYREVEGKLRSIEKQVEKQGITVDDELKRVLCYEPGLLRIETSPPIKRLEDLERTLKRPVTENDKVVMEELFKRMNLDKDLVNEPPQGVSVDKITEYQQLIFKMDGTFKHAINQLSVLVKDLVAGSRMTYASFYGEVQKYINASMSQYR